MSLGGEFVRSGRLRVQVEHDFACGVPEQFLYGFHIYTAGDEEMLGALLWDFACSVFKFNHDGVMMLLPRRPKS